MRNNINNFLIETITGTYVIVPAKSLQITHLSQERKFKLNIFESFRVQSRTPGD